MTKYCEYCFDPVHKTRFRTALNYIGETVFLHKGCLPLYEALITSLSEEDRERNNPS